MSARPLPAGILILFFALLSVACEQAEEARAAEDRFFKGDPEVIPEVHENRLGKEPIPFLRLHSADPVHWQPWSEKVFEHALKEQKPVFALVVDGSFPASHDVLKAIASSAGLRNLLHQHYVCTLIELHAYPELGLVSTILSDEIRKAPNLPSMIVLSHEKHPVGWLPIMKTDVIRFEELFEQFHQMFQDRWTDNPRYVVRNSEMNHENRLRRLKITGSTTTPAKLREAVRKAARELSALYDPISGEIDHSGGLVPFGLLQFASRVAAEPTTSNKLRTRLLEMVSGHSKLIMNSAIKDPLDGGVFSARSTRRWNLPVFVKDSSSQLEAVIALSQIATLTGNKDYLRHAEEILAFAESEFSDGKGRLNLTSTAVSQELTQKAYLWSRETLQKTLREEEYPLIEKCFGISSLGNIPIEADPKRRYMRLNSLSLTRTPESVAPELGLSPENARELYESARKRLLVHRQELLATEEHPTGAHRPAALAARHASALLELAAASGKMELVAKARDILIEVKRSHAETDRLMRIPKMQGRRGIVARGIDYALLLEAVFRLYREDLDPKHLVWANRLAAEAFSYLKNKEGLLLEAPYDDTILKIPSYSSHMVYGNSTWGTIYGPLARLHQFAGSERVAGKDRVHSWLQNGEERHRPHRFRDGRPDPSFAHGGLPRWPG